MARHFAYRRQWIFCAAMLAVWLALGWPFLHELVTGAVRRASPVPALWLVPYGLFGAAAFGAALLKLPTRLRWALICAQFAAVVAMTIIFPKDLMSLFLVIIAWQVAMATPLGKALGWVGLQTLAILGIVAQAPDPHLSYILVLSLVLQLCTVYTARTLRREADASRLLGQTNSELQRAQAIIADSVRDAERLRISRELHDAWGHELTALGLQLEIASHVTDARQANDHVVQAKGMARTLLAKVRDVVGALRDVEFRESPDGKAVRAIARSRGRTGTLTYGDALPRKAERQARQHRWIFGVAALALSLTLASPVLEMFWNGALPVSAPWLVSLALFGAAAIAAILLKLRPGLHWAVLCLQVAAVAAMAFVASWAMMASFLIVVAWQVAMTTSAGKALAWVAVQTLVVTGALALAPNPDLCWVIGKSFAMQLFFVFTAQALRQETDTARALARANGELRAAQAIIVATSRDAERLRISRELHDGWGHELTALGLQLEIASHLTEPGRAQEHVTTAKGLASELLGKVRDVVATLDQTGRGDLKNALEALARRVPVPAIHVEIASGVRVSPDQAHALIRCAQEAVTNAVKHSEAANLWLRVTADSEGVRLLARNDGSARVVAATAGSGLVGMRERLEQLGGRLAVRRSVGFGFTVDAWLPSGNPRPA
jgi:signal transduction histidine kinase